MFNVHPRVFSLHLFYFVFFFFFTRSGQNERHLSLFLLPSLKLTIFLILYKKHVAIDIADPSSMQDACHI